MKDTRAVEVKTAEDDTEKKYEIITVKAYFVWHYLCLNSITNPVRAGVLLKFVYIILPDSRTWYTYQGVDIEISFPTVSSFLILKEKSKIYVFERRNSKF